MKKILAILFTAVVLATMLIGCSKNNSEPVTEAGHIHNWEAVYDEDSYEASTETKTTLVCDKCGLDFSTYEEAGYGSALEYSGVHARETGHKGTRFEDVPVTSNSTTQTERVIVSYKCSCGATKNA